MWLKVTAHWQFSVNMHILRLYVWLEPLGTLIHLLADVQYLYAGLRFPKNIFHNKIDDL